MNAIEQVKSSAILAHNLNVSMSDIMDDAVCLYEALVGRPCRGLEGEWVRALTVVAVNKSVECRNTDDMPTPR